MSAFTFDPLERPFPRWMGPFSPARGTRSGFRFHNGRLGTWVANDSGASFWAFEDSQGARGIATLVRREWGGGRVLLLPNGMVVKPLQADFEVGRRALIGRFRGAIVLEIPGQTTFNLAQPGNVRPASLWPGPATTGLESTIQHDGALRCSWYHPTSWGREEISVQLLGPDHTLAAGFRAARSGNQAGRVRITANGHVITNRQKPSGDWEAVWVGRIDPLPLDDWDQWIERRRS